MDDQGERGDHSTPMPCCAIYRLSVESERSGVKPMHTCASQRRLTASPLRPSNHVFEPHISDSVLQRRCGKFQIYAVLYAHGYPLHTSIQIVLAFVLPPNRCSRPCTYRYRTDDRSSKKCSPRGRFLGAYPNRLGASLSKLPVYVRLSGPSVRVLTWR